MLALRIETTAGNFRIKLRDDRAPITCQYFSSLVSSGALDQGAIFRITTEANQESKDVPSIEVVQIGTPRGLNEDRQHIQHEPTSVTGLSHRRFAVSASRFAPGEVYRSFFVCMRDEPALDYGGKRRSDGQGYAVFGEVIEGRSILERIFSGAGPREALAEPIPIQELDLSRVTLTQN